MLKFYFSSLSGLLMLFIGKYTLFLYLEIELGIRNLALRTLIMRYFCLSINWDDDFIKWSAGNPIVRKNWQIIIMTEHGFMIGPSFVSNLLELIVNIFLKSASFETFELIAGIVERKTK